MSQLFRLKNGTVLLSTEAPGGIYNSGQLRKIAELCSKELAIVKATEDQRLALFVKESEVNNVAQQLRAMGLGFRHYQDNLHQPVSCLGELCEEHEQPAMATAMEITKEIAAIQLKASLKIGVNGCARCCTPCHTLDIAVVGDAAGYRISLGGKTQQMPEFASYFAEGVPASELPKRLKAVIEAYKNLAEDGETLHAVIERCGVADFVQALAPYSQDAAGRTDPFAADAEVVDDALSLEDADLSIVDENDAESDAGLDEIPIMQGNEGSLEDDLDLTGDQPESLEIDHSARIPEDDIDLDVAVNESPDLELEDEANVAASADEDILDFSGDEIAGLEESTLDESGLDVSVADESTLDDSDLEMSALDESDLDLSIADESNLDESTLDESSLDAISEESTLDESDLEMSSDESALDDSSLEMSALDESALDESGLEMSALDESTLDDSDLDMPVSDESALDESGLDVSASDKSTLDDSGLDLSVSDESALDESGLETLDESDLDVSVSDESTLDESGLETLDESDLDVSASDESTLDESGLETLDESDLDVSASDESILDESDLDVSVSDESSLDESSLNDTDLDDVNLDFAADESVGLEEEMAEDEANLLDESMEADLTEDLDDSALVADAPVDEDLEGLPELDEDLALEIPAAPVAPAAAKKAVAESIDFGDEDLPSDVPDLSDEEESQFEEKLHASIDEESRLIAKADKDPNIGDREAALNFLENSEDSIELSEDIELEASEDSIELSEDVELETEDSIELSEDLDLEASEDSIELSEDLELETIEESDDTIELSDVDEELEALDGDVEILGADEELEPIHESMEEFPEPAPRDLAHIKGRQLGQKLQGSKVRPQFKVSAISFQDEHMRVTFESGAYVDFELSALGHGEERSFRLGEQNVSVTSTSEGYILEVDGMRLFHPKSSLPAAS